MVEGTGQCWVLANMEIYLRVLLNTVYLANTIFKRNLLHEISELGGPGLTYGALHNLS